MRVEKGYPVTYLNKSWKFAEIKNGMKICVYIHFEGSLESEAMERKNMSTL